jgi:hypothetical protein
MEQLTNWLKNKKSEIVNNTRSIAIYFSSQNNYSDKVYED